ncbi:MAG TPA: hypothetical protein VF152_12235, partial [Acidimicrobiia bacterium]
YEAALIDFAAENADLFDEMRERAPLDIADDVAVVTDAYAAAATGDVTEIESSRFLDAEARVVDFDEEECGIDRGIF